jgi:hypothetical protein
LFASDKVPAVEPAPRGKFKLVEPLSECEVANGEAVLFPASWPRKHRRLPWLSNVIQDPAAP